jgi:hypothetical protein
VIACKSPAALSMRASAKLRTSVARFFVPHTRKSAAASGLQIFSVNE